MKSLNIVIVNYNSSDYLERCLRSVRSQTAMDDLRVTVVDNGSKDADWSLLRGRHPEVSFILNPRNLGFSVACNQGIRACPARFYLLLNPDTLILDSAIDKTLAYLEARPRVGIAGCRVKNPDGTLQLASRRSIPRPSTALFRLLGLSRLFPKSRLLAGYNLTYLDEDQTHPVEAVSGSFLMFRHELLEEIGGLDEDFFLYGEDLDFCRRALDRGWAVHYFAGASVIHFKRRSSSRDVEAANRHYYDSMKIYYRKHFASQSGRLKNAAVLAAIDVLRHGKRLAQAVTGKREVGSRD